ncbi:type II toxin-antitoxin system RelE/ParE family toxin [Sediminicoccus sp. KRV36]|uniref:type II toxin-antitoxin system RelE/ParE family toxin n=1 Tax=Sediminicoccus sp. KRV36 TaxID=3133721 RepID=UPI00200E9D5C|nr:type II toxin-antitoxin system RelE/ParE family toxin [Sediminicoccus rosea]UPY39182.1 type II toxin-antitoxin system RelE/ParE family toxin [Sediminicoccus rosea]
MKPVNLSRRAETDLAEAVGFIARENPAAAIAMRHRIAEAFALFARFPEAGIAQPGQAERILQAKGTPYRLIYRSDMAGVVILRIWHGARSWPPVS